MKAVDFALRPTKGGLLAIVPVGLAAMLCALLLPVRATPADIPFPRIDTCALAAEMLRDDELATEVSRQPLTVDVRAVGAAIRNFHMLEAQDEGEVDLYAARTGIDRTLLALPPEAYAELFKLRAVQMRGFLSAVTEYERTGHQSSEFHALAGSFLSRMQRVGWANGRTVLLSPEERRVLFKAAWNALLGPMVEARGQLALDEQRTLYGIYIRMPHAPESVLDSLRAMRHGATAEQGNALVAEERVAKEAWRLEKIKKLGALDAAYPTRYAVGVAEYRRGRYEASAQAFRDWLGAHPQGEYAIRARNHLLEATRSSNDR